MSAPREARACVVDLFRVRAISSDSLWRSADSDPPGDSRRTEPARMDAVRPTAVTSTQSRRQRRCHVYVITYRRPVAIKALRSPTNGLPSRQTDRQTYGSFQSPAFFVPVWPSVESAKSDIKRVSVAERRVAISVSDEPRPGMIGRTQSDVTCRHAEIGGPIGRLCGGTAGHDSTDTTRNAYRIARNLESIFSWSRMNE